MKPVRQAVDAGVSTDEQLNNNINRVLSRFFEGGLWDGTTEQNIINIFGSEDDDYYITLPRHLETCIRGGMPGTKPYPTQSQWYQYISGGYGMRTLDQRHYGALQDLGTGFCTFRNIETASTLTVSSAETEDAATYLYIRALDASGNKIYTTVGGEVIEGIRIDLSAAPATTSYTISNIYGLTKDITKGVVTVEDASNDLAYLEPGELIANYRRYLSGGYNADNWTQIKGIFKRKHVWAVADNDPLYPDSLEAIKFGLMALNYEEEADLDRAPLYWKMAVDLLNQQLKSRRLGSEGTMQLATHIGGGSIPVMI